VGSGLQAEDIIVAMDGRPLRVNSYADLDWFRKEVRTKRPGDALQMEVVRGASKYGKEPVERKTITVALGLAPPSQVEAAKLTLPEIGLKLRALTLDFLFANRLPENMGGVVADYVERAGPLGYRRSRRERRHSVRERSGRPQPRGGQQGFRASPRRKTRGGYSPCPSRTDPAFLESDA